MKLESLALHYGYESEATTKAAAVPNASQLRADWHFFIGYF